MFNKILIANRGEIACRVIRTCRKLGIKTVAVFSEIDSRALHVREADEAVLLGPAKAEESYLAMEKVIAIALQYNCEAIHPGYGFLSESSDFAELVNKSGLVFIGPSALVIRSLGDKINAKVLAFNAGVPIMPGSTKIPSNFKEALAIAEEIGYPLILKLVAGGGGKGMHKVNTPEEFRSAFLASKEEGKKFFGDDRIFLEPYLHRPRHIEIQIIADHYGNIIYLGERECSIQRRHQKIIEETPSLAVDESRRKKLGEMACSLAREVGYTNAGTVEFLLDNNGNPYFLEVNTRLQVEHPVTEMVTSLDLVELQILVASGKPLPLTQEEVKIKGWAIEARICAEDPAKNFFPTTGIITRYALPRGKNIRVDSGIEAGSLITFYYDSLLSKVIAWGENRTEAIESLIEALNRYHIEGLVTNLDFVNAILNQPTFINGELSTYFLEENFFSNGQPKSPYPKEKIYFMVLAVALVYHNRQELIRLSLKPMVPKLGTTAEDKKCCSYIVKTGDELFEVHLSGSDETHYWKITIDEVHYEVITPEFEFYRRRLKLKINGQEHFFRLQYRENFIWAAFCGITRVFEIYHPKEWQYFKYMPVPKRPKRKNILFCPMPGQVLEILVKKGDRVFRGQSLLSIESMKMVTFIDSPRDGIIEEVLVYPGQAVDTEDRLIIFKMDYQDKGLSITNVDNFDITF
ncbi:MAG: acetyl-CoA carboxylase biotin carboxylase subunit [Desulfobacterota bacterium]|nr:acetyl-CoA carboxylase biotin carboxylase subunit [Thermodesulfobacteriota bacterium]